MTDPVKGTLFIISAPSGTGKTSLVTDLICSDPMLCISVSYTTRPKRSQEEEGVNYHFVSDEQFQGMLDEGVFIEHAEVFRHNYGTSRQWVDKTLAEGKDVILEIEWQGAQQIRELYQDVVSIFILPPTLSSLRERLVGRAQDKSEVIEERLAEAKTDLEHSVEYDYLIVNDDFDIALNSLRAIIHVNRLKLKKQEAILTSILSDLDP